MSILGKLTEGVVSRDMKKEGAALLNKWEQTGLLEGLEGDVTKNNMARLLENQAKQLLKEAASSIAGGDVEGFAAVAFPIVRRVFGGLIANDLVSVQPMSLPSGLIFFLDFTFGGAEDNQGNLITDRSGFLNDSSLYGGGKVGAEITGGVDLTGRNGDAAGQLYNLTNGYTSPTGTVDFASTVVASGALGDSGLVITVFNDAGTDLSDTNEVQSLLRYDQDLTSGSFYFVAEVNLDGGSSDITPNQFDFDNLVAIALTGASNPGSPDATAATAKVNLVRRLSRLKPTNDRVGQIVFVTTASHSHTHHTHNGNGAEDIKTFVEGLEGSCAIKDDFIQGSAVGSVVGDTAFGLEAVEEIPEINLSVDSVSVTAQTKKLKAKWTPELGQDLNAYHNLDAEVELTSILSEQIALEIDREILEDLVKGATGATYYWSRSPGLFVNKETGAEVGASSAAPDFTGTVSEWYETLLETINDVSAQIHRKTLRGGANFIVTSPEVASILEMTSGFRANVTVEGPKGTAGPMNVGSLNKRLDVHVDPYFPRNLILVGRRGGSFLESGYVYAPYVPLQVTPTIFGVEDFVPRKGVMTRYAKKMVRPDMYGLVICRGLLGEAGATS
jgi:hypothetical protein